MIYGCKERKLLYLCSMICVMLVGLQYFKVHVQAEEYIYDELNRVIQVIYEDGGTVEYIYDNNGNIVKSIVSPGNSEGLGELPQTPESSESKEANEETDSEKELDLTKANGKNDSYKSRESEQKEDSKQSDNAKEISSYLQSGKQSVQTQDGVVSIDENMALFINYIVQKITEYAKQTFA